MQRTTLTKTVYGFFHVFLFSFNFSFFLSQLYFSQCETYSHPRCRLSGNDENEVWVLIAVFEWTAGQRSECYLLFMLSESYKKKKKGRVTGRLMNESLCRANWGLKAVWIWGRREWFCVWALWARILSHCTLTCLFSFPSGKGILAFFRAETKSGPSSVTVTQSHWNQWTSAFPRLAGDSVQSCACVQKGEQVIMMDLGVGYSHFYCQIVCSLRITPSLTSFEHIPCSSPITIVFDVLGGTHSSSDTVMANTMSKVSCHVNHDLKMGLKDVWGLEKGEHITGGNAEGCVIFLFL